MKEEEGRRIYKGMPSVFERGDFALTATCQNTNNWRRETEATNKHSLRTQYVCIKSLRRSLRRRKGIGAVTFFLSSRANQGGFFNIFWVPWGFTRKKEKEKTIQTEK